MSLISRHYFKENSPPYFHVFPNTKQKQQQKYHYILPLNLIPVIYIKDCNRVFNNSNIINI